MASIPLPVGSLFARFNPSTTPKSTGSQQQQQQRSPLALSGTSGGGALTLKRRGSGSSKMPSGHKHPPFMRSMSFRETRYVDKDKQIPNSLIFHLHHNEKYRSITKMYMYIFKSFRRMDIYKTLKR